MDRYRSLGLVIFGLAVVGGLVAVRAGVRDTWTGWRSTSWPTTAGVVTESSVTFTQSTERIDPERRMSDGMAQRTVETWFPVVHYSYEVKNRSLAGT